MRRLRAALIQTRTPASQGEALEHTAPLVEQAVVGGAEFIATPEGSNLLQRSKARFAETAVEPEHDVFVQGVRDLAKGHGVTILIGSALVKRPDGLFVNRSMLVTREGAISATYDKIHMFDVDLPTGEKHRESALYTPGERAVAADAPFGKLGLTVCYDVRFPHLYRDLARAGAEVITVPAAFTVPTGKAHWETLLRARAIENGCFILAPAQGGTHEDGRSTHGHSIAVAPWGEVIATANHDDPCVVFAELDLDEVAKARGAIPNLVNGREYAGP